MAAAKSSAAERFQLLFDGNTRSSGRYEPSRDRAWTVYEGAKLEDFQAHLDGKVGVGVVPICDDDNVWWAAIDIDQDDTDEDIPIHEIAAKISALKLPLIACRSKSGGVHCYLFLEKPQSAAKIRTYMRSWAVAIGCKEDVEIFPKQSRLVMGKDKERAKGNWINLPYMGGDETIRYAVRDGGKLSLDEFLDLAEKLRVSDADMRALASAEHPDAPPCIQKMYSQGVASGHRNEALYNIVVYHRKANPDAYESKSAEANSAVFLKPLPGPEAKRTIASASRPDCGYRCNEEPIRSLCDRETCLTRKFGITSADHDRLTTVEALPTFTDLTKFLTQPVRWEFRIDGKKVGNVRTEQLLDWRVLRIYIADSLTKVVPMIKNQEWERILQPLMATARIIEAPDDASVSGIMRDRLREFAAKADLANPGHEKDDRKALLRGLPVVQSLNGERSVYFRSQDFINYLKRTKSEELKGIDLWFAAKEMGVSHTRLRIPNAAKGEDNINVWYVPVKEVLRGNAEPVDFKSDL